MLRDENPALKDVAFPDTALYGLGVGDRLAALNPLDNAAGGGGAAATSAVQQRKTLLETWINQALKLCPGDSDLLQFLGDDNSITTTEARKLGIAVVSSAPSRTVTEATAPDNPGAAEEHRKRQQELEATLAQKDAKLAEVKEKAKVSRQAANRSPGKTRTPAAARTPAALGLRCCPPPLCRVRHRSELLAADRLARAGLRAGQGGRAAVDE